MLISARFIMEDFAQRLIKGIQENIKSKQVTPFGSAHSTGEAENSLFYRIDDNRLIVGSTWAYITVLEDGRKPGKFAPPEVIEKWLEDKPIPFSDNSNFPGALTKSSLAYLINKKLKEEGSLIWQQGGKSGILSDYINIEYIHNNLTLPIRKALINEVTQLLFHGDNIVMA
jgi:hypothetical protein